MFGFYESHARTTNILESNQCIYSLPTFLKTNKVIRKTIRWKLSVLGQDETNIDASVIHFLQNRKTKSRKRGLSKHSLRNNSN